MPSLQTIAATDIHAGDYKKNHSDDNKYNVSHLTAPNFALFGKILPQEQCQPFRMQGIKLQTRQPTTSLQFAGSTPGTVAKRKHPLTQPESLSEREATACSGKVK